jgi:hypothetical protein
MIKEAPNHSLSLEEELHQSYPEDALDDVFLHHFEKFLDKSPNIFEEWNLDRKEFTGLSIRKREIVRLFAIVFSDRELFNAWFAQLPFSTAKVLESIVWEGKQSIFELDKRTKGRVLLEPETRSFFRNEIHQDFCLFQVSQIPIKFPDKETLVYLDIPSGLRKKLKLLLPHPKGYHLKPLKTPQATLFSFFDHESILECLPVAMEYIRQGKLQCTNKGTPHKRSLHQLAKVTGLREFYPGQPESDLKTMRVRFISDLLLLGKTENLSGEPPKLLRKLFNVLEHDTGSFYFRYMSQIKGWYHISPYIHLGFHKSYFHLLSQMACDKWLSLNQLSRFAQVRGFNLSPVFDQAYLHLYLKEEWRGWGNKKQPVFPDQFSRFIDLPLLKSAFFLFAALGLVDLMYDLPDQQILPEDTNLFYSNFCGLRYARLTQLGSYVSGQTDEYTKPEQKLETAQILLDEDRLILSLDKKNAGIEMNLEQIAQRIGRLRFKVDFSTFFSGCHDQNDIDIKIELFHRTLGHQLPAIWVEFLSEIKKRTRAVKIEEDFTVLKLAKNNTDLIELIKNDPDFRNRVLLAEDYHILIRNEDLQTLRDRLLNLGYLFY